MDNAQSCLFVCLFSEKKVKAQVISRPSRNCAELPFSVQFTQRTAVGSSHLVPIPQKGVHSQTGKRKMPITTSIDSSSDREKMRDQKWNFSISAVRHTKQTENAGRLRMEPQASLKTSPDDWAQRIML